MICLRWVKTYIMLANPNNVKKGRVWVYYKETLTISFLQTKLDQCTVSQMTFKYKKESRVITLYRFLLQTTDESDNLFQLFEEL